MEARFFGRRGFNQHGRKYFLSNHQTATSRSPRMTCKGLLPNTEAIVIVKNLNLTPLEEDRARSEAFSAIQQSRRHYTNQRNISSKNTFFCYLVKILKVLTRKSLQPTIWLLVWITAFSGMTLLNLE
jgi:hypothetical protein